MDADEMKLHRVRWERAWTRQDRASSTFYQYFHEVATFNEWCKKQDLQTSSLDAADLYVAHLERSSTRHMARYAARAIKAFGRYLAEQYDEPNPFAKLKLPPEPAVQHAPTATAGDLSKLLEACTPSKAVWNQYGSPWDHLRDKAIILLLARTGMRRGEVANMTLDDLDLINQTLKVPHTKTKTPRIVYLPDDVVDAIVAYQRASASARPQGDRAVWLGTNGKGLHGISSNAIGQMLYRRGKAAGVDVSAHSFRRMFAGDWMAKAGSETGLMQVAGWKSTAMIQRYSKDTIQANALAEAQRLMG